MGPRIYPLLTTDISVAIKLHKLMKKHLNFKTLKADTRKVSF